MIAVCASVRGTSFCQSFNHSILALRWAGFHAMGCTHKPWDTWKHRTFAQLLACWFFSVHSKTCFRTWLFFHNYTLAAKDPEQLNLRSTHWWVYGSSWVHGLMGSLVHDMDSWVHSSWVPTLMGSWVYRFMGPMITNIISPQIGWAQHNVVQSYIKKAMVHI